MAEEVSGLFNESLIRSNSQIKKDRAEAITEDTEITFQRKVQDLARDIKNLKRKRNGMLDLSPTNSMSLMVANEFNSSKFVEEDLSLGVEIRNLEIKHQIAAERFEALFGREA